MTISTFTELQTATVDWYKDRTDLTAFAPDFVALAEAYFNLNLRVREMMTVVDLTPDLDGICTLPSDYIEYIGVGELASIHRSLEFITNDMVDVYYPSSTAGLSNHFTIFGNTLIAYPISSNDMRFSYYATIPPLASTGTNWLLTKSPNLYLHTCLMYAAEFQHEDSEMAKEATLVTRFVELLQNADTRGRFGNVGMTPRGPTP
jgi:hypothetical protein